MREGNFKGLGQAANEKKKRKKRERERNFQKNYPKWKIQKLQLKMEWE